MVRNETARAVRNLPAGTALARNKSLATRRRPRMERWMAIPAGFEPATRGVEIRYSIQLSYGTVASISYHRRYQKARAGVKSGQRYAPGLRQFEPLFEITLDNSAVPC